MVYPVNSRFAIEAMAIESSLIYLSKMAIFHSHVELPEGNPNINPDNLSIRQ
jgi:hypothetical protein